MDKSEINYISQELELDAFTFTKFCLERFESIPVKNRNEVLEDIINQYMGLIKEVF